jgi:hypothetical protein
MLRNLWALVLLALTCFTVSSKADIVTVPLQNGLSVTVMTGQSTGQLQDLKNNPLATNVTMGDDSNRSVPLGFDFPYYGKTFNQSWMYSNGGVSFSGGNAPGGFCCSGLNLATLRDTSYNYSIVPLWTDLIAIQGGSQYTLGTPTSMTYGWYGVSEYYNASKRSTFEVKIDNTGLLDVKFSGALVSSHQVTSGFIGDISKGEYYQYYTGYGLNSGPFSYTLSPTQQTQTDPCKDNVLSSPSCPGYLSALAKLSSPSTSASVEVIQPTTVSTSTESVIVSPTIAVSQPLSISSSPTSSSPEPIQQNTNPAAGPVGQPATATATNQAVSSPSPTANNPQPKVGEVQTAGSSKPSVSISQIMSIVSSEQSRVGGVEKATVQAAVDQASKDSAKAKEEAESVAGSLTTTSIASSTSSSSGSQNVSGPSVRTQQSTSSFSLQTNTQTSAASISALKSPIQSSQSTITIQNNTPEGFVDLASLKPQVRSIQPDTSIQNSNQQSQFEIPTFKLPVMVTSVDTSSQTQNNLNSNSLFIVQPQQQTFKPQQITPEVETPRLEGIKMSGRSPMNDYVESKPLFESGMVEQKNETFSKTISNNELAGGVDISSIAVTPKGYEQYTFTLSDARFYEPKEIYKNQSVTDNVRLLRGLGSDRLHQEMVNQQYRTGN